MFDYDSMTIFVTLVSAGLPVPSALENQTAGTGEED